MRHTYSKGPSGDRGRPTLKSRLEYQANVHQTSLIAELKKLRLRLNYTQAGLAESVGISQPALTRIETCTSNPLLGTVLLLLAAMNRKLVIVPLDYQPPTSSPDDPELC